MKIYWFKRKEDNYYFPVESLIHASNQVKRKDFKQKFEYVGYSDGSAYKEVFKGETIPVNENNLEEQLGPGQYKKRAKLTKEAYLREIEMAKNNPDKRLPLHKAYGVASSQFSGEQAAQMISRRYG